MPPKKINSSIRRKKFDGGNAPSEHELTEQFRFGAKNSVCRRIWHGIRQQFYGQLSQTDIAARLQVSRSNVNRWGRGDLSFGNLVSILADTQKQWEDLPPRPQNQNLRIGGLARILHKHFLEPVDQHDEEVALIATQVICCLVVLMQHQTEWRQLHARLTKNKSELDRLAENISQEADGVYRQYLQAIPFKGVLLDSAEDSTVQVQFRTVSDLNRLDVQFGDIWDHFEDADMAWQDEEQKS